MWLDLSQWLLGREDGESGKSYKPKFLQGPGGEGKRVKQARCETIESDGNCGEEEAYPSSKGGQCCSALRNLCPELPQLVSFQKEPEIYIFV